MPVNGLTTPTPWVTAPVPATAPDTTNVLIRLSTSESVPAGVAVLWMTPLAALTVRSASSGTLPTSATATGGSLTALTVKDCTTSGEIMPLSSVTVNLIDTGPLKLGAGTKVSSALPVTGSTGIG